MLNTDGDLGRHLTLGAYMLDTRSVPSSDILSFTKPGHARPPYEWIAQIVLTLAYRLLDLDGVVLLVSAAIAAAFLVVHLDGVERSRAPLLAALVVTWAAMASSLHWLTRPHVFSFVLFAVWIRSLERLRTRRTAAVWQFPLLMLLWANTHGGFVLGIAAWIAYMAGWTWQAWRGAADKTLGSEFLLVGAASLVASAVTPDAWHNWDAVLQNHSAFILARTVETRALDVLSPSVWPFVTLLSTCLLLLPVVSKRLVPAHAFLLAGLGAASWSITRNIPYFALAAAPILIEWLSTSVHTRSRWLGLERALTMIEAGARGIVLPSMAVLVALGSMSLHRTQTGSSMFPFSSTFFPVAAANWIGQHPPKGNMLNDVNWGGYLLFRLWPGQRVFMDSQSDFYGEELSRQYEQLIAGRGTWRESLTQYRIGWVIVPASSGLAANLALEPSWKIMYEDSTARILARAPSP
jgi:hypothetical protein